MTLDAGAQEGELSPADGSGPRELLRYPDAETTLTYAEFLEAVGRMREVGFPIGSATSLGARNESLLDTRRLSFGAGFHQIVGRVSAAREGSFCTQGTNCSPLGGDPG